MHLTKIASTPTPVRSLYRTIVVLFFAALLLLFTVGLLRQSIALAQPGFSLNLGPTIPTTTRSVALTTNDVGASLPRIQCEQGYTATVYAEGLSSPDGLAFGPAGALHVAEETAGRVSYTNHKWNRRDVLELCRSHHWA